MTILLTLDGPSQAPSHFLLVVPPFSQIGLAVPARVYAKEAAPSIAEWLGVTPEQVASHSTHRILDAPEDSRAREHVDASASHPKPTKNVKIYGLGVG